MIPWEAISGILGMVIPPVVRLFKGKKKSDPETVMGDLSATNPEVLPEYMKAMSGYIEALKGYYNRDLVPGSQPSKWVVDLRAAIRPITVGLSAIALVISYIAVKFFEEKGLDVGTGAALSSYVGSWMGSKISFGR